MSTDGNQEFEELENTGGSPEEPGAIKEQSKSPEKASTKKASKSRSKSRSRSRSNHKRSKRSRSRSYHSRSRSRSRSRSKRHRRRSRSRSHRRRYREGRSHSRSPMSNRRRHQGSRENPKENNCLGVFGLSLYTTERDMRDVYEHYGPLESVNVVYDHQTGRSRGFSFVTFENISDAREARERTDGIEVDGRRIRVDYSITERAHTPTPGVYMGKPTHSSSSSSSRRDSYGYRDRYRRSPSPYYRRSPSPYYRRSPSPYYRRTPSPYYRHRRSRYSRSRSRTFSPSRY